MDCNKQGVNGTFTYTALTHLWVSYTANLTGVVLLQLELANFDKVQLKIEKNL